METGIYDVITKGLVPKSVDMTPALGIGGSPLSITKKKYDGKNSNRIYNRSEVATGNLDKFTYNKYEVNELYNNRNNSKIKLEPITKDWGIKSKRKEPFYHETLPENRKNAGTNVNKTLDIENANVNNNVFITAGNTNMSEIQEMTENNMLNNISEIKAKNNSSIKFNNSSSTNAYSRSRQLNSNASKQMNSYSKTIKIEDETIKSFPDYILDIDMTNNIIISFELYKLTKNENYYKFINENKDKIFQIENILNNMCNLFKKLNIINASIDSNKILSLLKFYKNKIENITNKDLLYCMTNDDFEKKGFEPKNEKILYQKIREAFIIRIQKMIRRKLAYNKYQFLKIININVTFLQSHYRRFIIEKKVKKILEEEKIGIHNKFMELFNNFKLRWDKIQNTSRMEIHFFSISKDSYNNCLIDKYSLTEALQLNRLIRLVVKY